MRYWSVCPTAPSRLTGVEASRPEWFAAFLADRGTRKPSAHTLKTYRQDFDAIATLIAGGEDLSGMALGAITIDTTRTAFAQYAETHEAASDSAVLVDRCSGSIYLFRNKALTSQGQSSQRATATDCPAAVP
jgi:hypothetical protein